MSQYTPIERTEIVELYTKNQNSIILTQRAYRAKYPKRKAPDPKTIRALYSKAKSSGSLDNMSHSTRKRRARSNINITKVRERLAENPNVSIRSHAEALGISYSSLRRILQSDLNLTPHKVQTVQRLKPDDTNRIQELLDAQAIHSVNGQASASAAMVNGSLDFVNQIPQETSIYNGHERVCPVCCKPYESQNKYKANSTCCACPQNN